MKATLFFTIFLSITIYGADSWWPDKCNTCDTILQFNEQKIIKYKCTKTRYTKAEIKNSKYNGKYLSWDKKGNLRVDKTLCDNKPCGPLKVYDSLGNILSEKMYSNDKRPIGKHKIYYNVNQPERFISNNNNGKKHGWEVFWYENGNVKDSILFHNDSTFKRKSFYQNGILASEEKDIYGSNGYNAISYDTYGKKTGEIKNGTGSIFVCDSLGENCHELEFKEGKRVFK